MVRVFPLVVTTPANGRVVMALLEELEATVAVPVAVPVKVAVAVAVPPVAEIDARASGEYECSVLSIDSARMNLLEQYVVPKEMTCCASDVVGQDSVAQSRIP